MSSQKNRYRMLGTLLLCGLAGTVAAQDAPAKTTAKLDKADVSFVQKAAADGMAEVQLGQLALSNSSNPEVKTAAQQLIDDHGKANEQLKSLATSKQVELPTAISADATKQAKTLQSLHDAAFDQTWAKDMVSDHQAAIKLFGEEAKQTDDADLRQFTKATLPTLNQHLKMAQQLAAVPDARDQAMSQAIKSINSEPASMPTPTAAPTAAPAPVAAPAAIKH
jgi:putative membrane protein